MRKGGMPFHQAYLELYQALSHQASRSQIHILSKGKGHEMAHLMVNLRAAGSARSLTDFLLSNLLPWQFVIWEALGYGAL